MNTAALDLAILGLPFVAGLLVLATHVPLGRQVLDRGIVFIDLAIAQIDEHDAAVEHLHAQRHVCGQHQQPGDERQPEDREIECGGVH